MAKTKPTSKKDRHVRWNWEQTSRQDADLAYFVEYHFIVADDKDREGIMRRIVWGLSRYGEVIQTRSVEGMFRGTGLRYLFRSYYSVIKPDMIDWSKVKRPVRKDSELRERKGGKWNIEDYVANVYGG